MGSKVRVAENTPPNLCVTSLYDSRRESFTAPRITPRKFTPCALSYGRAELRKAH